MKYATGEIKAICEDYAEMRLMNKEGKVVYKATIPLNEIDVIIAMNKNIIKTECVGTTDFKIKKPFLECHLDYRGKSTNSYLLEKYKNDPIFKKKYQDKQKETLDCFVKKMGFESEKEMNILVTSIDLANPNKMREFINWKRSDGTKNGLLKIIG